MHPIFLSLASSGAVLAKLWPFPVVVGSTFLIAWATEVASFFVSRGMALAVLALLEVLPEFAVEAVIAKNAALDPSQIQYVTANFTGANRILVGLGLPVVFLLAAMGFKRAGKDWRELSISGQHSVEVVFLLLASLYSLVFYFTDTLRLRDTVILVLLYGAYIAVLFRMPPSMEGDQEMLTNVPRRVMKRSRRFQRSFAVAAFAVGGLFLLASVEPFYHNMLGFAAAIGISAYILVQWVAPVLSEAPEFLTVTYWSRSGRGEQAFVNLLSAKINQWTLLIAMIPVVFQATSILGNGGVQHLTLDKHQQVEILLTAAQGLFAVACIMKMRFLWWEAALLFCLWALQLFDPVLDPFIVGSVPSILGSGAPIREWVTLVYFLLIGVEFLAFGREWKALRLFGSVLKAPHLAPRLAAGREA